MTRSLAVEWLGRVPYADALELQRKRVDALAEGSAGDVLFLLEHPPVLTLGRGADRSNLLVDEATLAARGIELHTVSRGGDVTLHAPGQLVGYLIVDLAARAAKDVHQHLRTLEAGLIDALAELGVACDTREGMTGVFVAGSEPPRKLASIGVGVRRWVTFHGFALNVTLDPAEFELIVPCGLQGVQMTSVARELDGPREDLDEAVRTAVGGSFTQRLAP